MTAKPTLLVVSPLPPSWSGVATYTEHLLLGGLCDDWDVTLLLRNGDPEPPERVKERARVIHARSLSWYLEVDPPDRVLHCMGNSEYHIHGPEIVARLGGVVLAHDIRMNVLHCARSIHSVATVPLSEIVRARHGRLLADEVADWERRGGVRRNFAAVRGRLDASNTYLLDAAVRGAGAIAVHSEFARRLADFELGGVADVHVVPFGHLPPSSRRESRPSGDVPLLSTFGLVAPEKASTLLIDSVVALAAAGVTARLRYVGYVDEGHRRLLQDRADAGGVGGLIEFTGRVDDDRYRQELSVAHIAVQLRVSANGEASAAIADCLSAGLPTIVTDLGGQACLPDDVVVKVPAGSDAKCLAEVMSRLIRDAHLRSALSEQTISYARTNSFQHAAARLTELLHETPRAQI